mgnify:CR=1 FL=1
MRLLLTSDLHYKLRQYDWLIGSAARFDVVVVAGDHIDAFLPVPSEVQIAALSATLTAVARQSRLLVCSGNHDLNARNDEGEKTADWLDPVRSAALAVDGDSVVVDDVLFTLCPWWDGPHARARLERELDVIAAVLGEEGEREDPAEAARRAVERPGSGRPRQSLAEHQAILVAVAAHDPVVAVARYLRHMATLSSSMLRNAVRALDEANPALAREVLERDKELDEEFATALRQVMSFVMEDQQFLRATVDTVFALKGLERIGDHAKNIAEQVLYMVEGERPRKAGKQ